MKKLLLGITGGVATKLTAKMVEDLQEAGFEVQVIATEKARQFVDPSTLSVPVWYDSDEWPNKLYQKDDDVMHIERRDWADILLIAPLTANTLSKMANGICDNLLSTIVYAWHKDRPVVVAPAMNTTMWEHPKTAKHLKEISSWLNLTIVDPVDGKLACGVKGMGAMANIHDIVVATARAYERRKQ
jgi:phosphopantothenoylcysteine decarboxylase